MILVLLPSDGTSQQVGTSSGASALDLASGGAVMTLECPQASMMGNHSEGDMWMVEIQLMYAQQWSAGTSELSQHQQSIQTQQQLLQQQILMSRGGGGVGVGGGAGEVGGVVGGVSGNSASGNGADVKGVAGGQSSSQDAAESSKRVEKSLRELLEEQDIGELLCVLHA